MGEAKQFKNDPNTPRKYRRKHMWWRYLLVFLGGFLFAGVGTLSGVAIASATVPTSTVTDNLPPEVSNFLRFLDNDDTLFGNIMKFVYKEKSVDTILDSIELRYVISKDMVGEVLQKKMAYFPDETAHVDEIDTTDIEGWRPINLNMLIKGAIPEKDGNVNFVDHLMNNLVIKDLLSVDGTPLAALADTPIKDVASQITKIKIGVLFPDASGIIASISDLTLEDLGKEDALDKIYVKDLLGQPEGDTGNRFMNAMCYEKVEGNLVVIDYSKPRTVAAFKDLDSLFNQLVLDDFVEIDGSNKLLASLSGTSINGLADKLSNLAVKDIINPDDIAPGIGKNVIVSLLETKINDLGNALGDVKIVDALKDEIFDGEGNINGYWKMMLYKDIKHPDEEYKTYTLNDFGVLVTNMTNNVKDGTMDNFVECGILDISQETLDKVVGTIRIGDMTITGLIDAISLLTSGL